MSLGPVFSVGVHILDILGRPVDSIPPGQASVLLEEIRATAAGTAAGPSVDLARLGVPVFSCGAIGGDALGDLLLMLLNKEGVDTRYVIRKAGQRTSATILPIRPNGERPALHAPGATQMLEPGDLTAEIFDLAPGNDAHPVLHIGSPDALGLFAGEPLPRVGRWPHVARCGARPARHRPADHRCRHSRPGQGQERSARRFARAILNR